MKIVDEFTGRVLEGRRYSEGLHQAIEAKEGVRIKEENQTLATITIQNYFKMYDKLVGHDRDGQDRSSPSSRRPTRSASSRSRRTGRRSARDEQDLIYKTEDAKWNARRRRHHRAQRGRAARSWSAPVSIEKSEMLSGVLNRRGVPHHVLNAKNHEKEAMIVAQAGRKGAVTVATNMAGRGVDILLGGNPEYLARQEMAARDFDNDRYLLFEMDDEERAGYEAEYEPIFAKLKAQTDAEHDEVVELGGLYVLGTERHESRRIDNQLRGRSGRQGDPGESRFYLSLEDDLMRMFAERSGRPRSWSASSGRTTRPIEAKMVSRAVENAQKPDRGAQLRAPQERPEVRRGDERPARGDLRRAPEDPRGPGPAASRREGSSSESSSDVSDACPTDVFPEDWDLDGLCSPRSPEVYPGARSRGRPTRPSADAMLGALFVEDALAAVRPRRRSRRRRRDARPRARRPAEHHRHEVARAPLRDGLPAGGHPPAALRAEGPDHRVPA